MAGSEKQEKTRVAAANGLNLRRAPKGAVITVLPHGTAVKVVTDEGEWAEVKAGKLSGWVMTKYLGKE